MPLAEQREAGLEESIQRALLEARLEYDLVTKNKRRELADEILHRSLLQARLHVMNRMETNIPSHTEGYDSIAIEDSYSNNVSEFKKENVIESESLTDNIKVSAKKYRDEKGDNTESKQFTNDIFESK